MGWFDRNYGPEWDPMDELKPFERVYDDPDDWDEWEDDDEWEYDDDDEDAWEKD